MIGQIMSHSIHKLSIQINTSWIGLSNINLSSFTNHMKGSFPLCTFLKVAGRLLDTLENAFWKVD